ncbi:GNAT family N-acetyltransferase [Aquibacillus salsiterrae]|uniref:GNAT family N-acetyltransferase n=1 Tax=Aquibacillus salsiterrae TaxID=2950439 RepID=A0A9X3WFJ9_9BACI|nr:GNAT family N-acetyltransferase [Aquibacillus salsiterrae]MDC3416509.1 GNAT family N-acetyltransferase [Aquibacillus salsiterrae]
MYVICSNRLRIKSLPFEMATHLLLDRKTRFDDSCFSLEFPSFGFKAALPLYLEQRSPLQYGLWLIRSNEGTCIGEIVTKRDESNAIEIGYLIFEQFRKKGYATEAVKMLVDWLKTQKVQNFVAYCDIHNNASQRVLVKNGFTITDRKKMILTFEKGVE